MEARANLSIANKKNIILTIVLILSVIIGFLIRIKGLGKWPLAVDEYYIVKSVKSILQNGLPNFFYGGYYDRGILYQYMTAILLLMGIKVEFAVRIIPLITNLLVIHPLYLLSKKAGGRTLAVTVIIVFCFSVWEVEFARFARMYSPFQLIFAWYLYFFYKNTIENDHKALKWLFILSTISIFVYEASIFLVILNFFPFIWDKSKKTINFFKIRETKSSLLNFILCALIFIITYFYLSFNFNSLGTTHNLPADIDFKALTNHSGGSFRVPLILLQTIISNPFWIIPFFIITAMCIYGFVKINRTSEIKLPEKLSLLFIIILSLLNLFGLVIFIILLFLLINWIDADDLKKHYKFLSIFIVLPFLFWSAYSIFTISWHFYFPNEVIHGALSSLKIIWKEFIDFPYLYEAYALFRDTLPHLTFITVILLTAGIFISIFLKNEKNEEYKFLFFIFLLLMLFVTTLNLTYFKTRYFFFLYPVVILLNFITIKRLVNKYSFTRKIKTASFLMLTIAYLIISEDFNINHLYKIDSKEVNFRENYSMRLKDHFYPRWDERTPDEYVNKHIKKEDIVIIDEQVSEFYLKHKVNYIYKNYKNLALFIDVSRLNGTREKWTGANLIYKSSDLKELLLKGDKTKWLILNTEWGNRLLKYGPFFCDLKKYEIFSNSDSTTIVYKIPPILN